MPAHFAVHKLILSQKRQASGRVKRAKDLAHAAALIAALDVQDRFALADAHAQGARGWAEPIARSLVEIGRAEA